MHICILGDAPELGTGFSNQGTYLAQELSKEHDITYLACHGNSRMDLPYKVIPFKSIYDTQVIESTLMQLKYDYLICLADTYILPKFKTIGNSWYFWIPVDSNFLPKVVVEHLKNVNIVSPSLFGNKVFGALEVPYKYIPMHIDSIFQPEGEKKYNLYRKLNRLEGKFILFDSFRNQPRKCPELLLQFFTKFSKDKDDAFLILNTNLQDPYGVDLEALINFYNIKDKVRISLVDPSTPMPKDKLNMLYNMVDLRVSTSSAEGFGLVAGETLKAGTHNLLCNHTTSEEFVSGPFLYAYNGSMLQNGYMRFIPDINDMTEKANYLYENRDVLETPPVYTTHDADIIGRWKELFITKKKVKKEKRKKVLIAAMRYYPPYGGGELCMHERALALKDKYEVEAFCTRDSGGVPFQQSQVLDVDGIKVTQCFVKNIIEEKNAFSECVSDSLPDVVITWAEAAPMVYPVCRDNHIPVINTVNFWGGFLKNFDGKCEDPKVVPDLLYLEVLKASKVITNSYYTQKIFEKYGIPSDVIFPLSGKVPVVKKGNKIGCINSEWGKGGGIFLDLVKKYPAQQFLAIYPLDGIRNIDKSLFEEYPNLEIWKFQKDIMKFYEQLKILCCFSLVDETFCRAALEAQLNGIPVLSTQMGNLKYLNANKNLILNVESSFNPPSCSYNKEQLYEKFEWLLDKKNYKSASRQSRLLQKEYSYEDSLKKFVNEVDKFFLKEVSIIPKSKDYVLCLVDPGYLGVKSSFEHLSRVVKGVRVCSDPKKYQDEINENPRTIILGGWSKSYETINTKNLMISWCSDISQMESCNETSLFYDKILPGLNTGRFKKVFVSSEKFAEFFPGLEWLPCTVDVDSVVAKDPIKLDGRNFGLFTYPHHRKNVALQSLVAQKLGTLHCNSFFMNSYVRNFLQPGKYQSWGFPETNDLYNIMAGMDVGLCAFFTETFCYGAIEYMLLGVPVLLSSLIPFIEYIDSPVRQCISLDITNPVAVSRSIREILDQDKIKLGISLRKSALKFIERHNKLATKVLGVLE